MQHEGVYPDTVTLICMLKACDGTELASRGYELHMEISQRGLDRDLHIGSSLVHMYAKAGSLDDARKVFHGIAVRDVTLWTSLMMGYADDGKHEEAINCYKKMQSEQISPNSVTYPCILKACSIMREIGQGQLIHKDIEIKGEKNTTVGNALINLYASCLLLAEAEHVFNTLQEWDQVSWNVLIGAFSNQGYPIEAIQYFFQMLIMGYSPDAVTFMYILKACSNLACSHGRTIHAEMVKRGMECELLSSSSLIDFYASHGLLKEAQDTFDKLSDIDVVSWTVLIAGYVDHGLGEHALESFDCMRLKSFSPAPVTLESCLKASASLGAMTKVHEFHAEITRRGWQKGVIIESSLVDSYAKCGCMLEAQSVFDKASCRNVVTWSALIAGYAQNGAIQNVVCTLKNMFLEGMQPNSVTISSILSACSHAGALEEAHVFYETLKDHYNFSEHITCMLDFFCRAGQFESAITLLDQMPFYPCSMVWRNIVGACQKQGNVELGMHVIEHAIHIDKQNTALYMNILNMFSHVHS
ncbi:hypothetical protein KP509_26G011100 [Ceratopteris richardii]|nr:hypothetical protein KP509_26G011100 [Ceratopteris richardii]